jgi:MoaA/NifB/PqqE/SkfB family radical SAM enzyme
MWEHRALAWVSVRVQRMGYPADWRITSRCTLACDFCYGPVPGNDPLDVRPQILRALKSSSADIITFCGGEPLLVSEIGDYAAELRTAGKRTILNTNGSLLRYRLSQRMPVAFDVVGLSLDGSTEAMHRKMRGRRADFRAVLDAAQIIADTPRVSLKIATVVSQVNQDDIPALARLVRKIKPDIWRMYQYTEVGLYNRGQIRHRISTSKFERIAEVASVTAAPIKFYASTAQQQGPGCLIVSMDGTVFQATPELDIVYGNCLEIPLDQIWHKISHSQLITQNKLWHDLVMGDQISAVPGLESASQDKT